VCFLSQESSDSLRDGSSFGALTKRGNDSAAEKAEEGTLRIEPTRNDED